MTPDKVEAALGVLESARRALCSQDLREVLMNVQNNINSPACAGMANAALVRMDRLPDLREALATLTSALAEREWRPIESAPKSLQEICELYPDDFGSTILIARADEEIPGEHGVICGCVAEATLLEDGRWASPTAPELPSMGDGWTEIVNPTHWKPMPRKPAMKDTDHDR